MKYCVGFCIFRKYLGHVSTQVISIFYVGVSEILKGRGKLGRIEEKAYFKWNPFLVIIHLVYREQAGG